MISVVIPYRDAEPWLGRCAASLWQDGDFEILFVNDNSSDAGEAIVAEAAKLDNRIRMADNTHRPGVSGARNTGIDLARGEWVAFLDADDEMLPGAYDTMQRVIAADPRANVHQLNHLRYYTRIDKLVMKYTNPAGTYTAKRLPKMWFGVWNKIYRREFLFGLSFDERLQYGEDGLFVLTCLAKDNYIHHASRGCAAVKHRFDNPRSLSKSKTRRRYIDYVHALEELLMECEDPTIRVAIRDILSEHWGSGAGKKTFAEEEG